MAPNAHSWNNIYLFTLAFGLKAARARRRRRRDIQHSSLQPVAIVWGANLLVARLIYVDRSS